LKTHENYLIKISYFFLLLFSIGSLSAQNKIIVLQTDFGLKDGAVSTMKGVGMVFHRS